MDNLTHSAVGATFTEILYQFTEKKIGPSKTRQVCMHSLSVLAANLPDLDLLFQLLDPSRLGYMINHRGHTHTFLGIGIAYLILFLISSYFFKKLLKENFSITDFKLVSAISIFGLMSHIGLDFMNSYGVHPFAPFSNKWFYGDFIFILEPLIWISLAIPFFSTFSKKNFFKYIFLIIALVSPVLFYKMGVTNSMHLSLTYAFAALLCFLSTKFSKVLNLYMGTMSFALVILIFFNLSRKAKIEIQNSFVEALPSFKLLDVITSPFPGSFTCWHFTAVGISEDVYVSFSGTYAPSQSLLLSCGSGSRQDGISLEPTNLFISKKIKLDGFLSNSFEELKYAYSATCKSKSWFSFARAPYIKDNTLYDLRYSLRSKKTFSTYKIDLDDKTCLRLGATWTPPRIDLLKSL